MILSQSHTLLARYPALAAVDVTPIAQSLPRSDAGLGADLFDLGVHMSRTYAAYRHTSLDNTPYIAPTFREPSFMG